MATVSNDQDQQQNPQGNQPPTTAGTSAPTGSGTGKGVGAQSVSPVQQNQAAQNQSGYTDVASYLNANPGGGSNLGNQVASNLNQGYQSTQNAINQSVNAANTAIGQGYTPENTQLIQQVAANPTQSAGNADTLSQFQGQLNDTYGGPTNWADYGTQQGAVAQAQQNASLVNAPGGNNALIQQVENQTQPGHTSQGINALDTLLYQGNPQGVATAQAAAKPYAGLTDYLNQANTGIQGNIASAQNNASQAQQDALNAFTGTNGTLTNLNNTVNANAATALTGAQQQQQQLNADIANLYGGVAQNNTQGTVQGFGAGNSQPWYNTQNYNVGQLSPQDLASLGMTQDQWNALQGSLQQAGTTQNVVSNQAGAHNFGAYKPTSQLDISQYLQQQAPSSININAANTATPEQYQQMAAINQLLGSKAPTQGEALNPAMASQAGTYNPGNLNQFNYQNALTAAQGLGTAEQQAAQQEANQLENAATASHAAGQHGGFLQSLKQDLGTSTGLLNTIGSVFNPTSWAANARNVVNGNPVNATAFNPTAPQQALTTPQQNANAVGGFLGAGAAPLLAEGGEVKDISDYLNKRKR